MGKNQPTYSGGIDWIKRLDAINKSANLLFIQGDIDGFKRACRVLESELYGRLSEPQREELKDFHNKLSNIEMIKSIKPYNQGIKDLYNNTLCQWLDRLNEIGHRQNIYSEAKTTALEAMRDELGFTEEDYDYKES